MAVRVAVLYLVSTLLLLGLLGGALYVSTEQTLRETRRQELQTYADDDAAFLQRAVSREDDLLTLAPVLATTLPHAGGPPRSVRLFSSNGTLLASLPPGAQDNDQHPSRAVLDQLPLGLLSLTLTPSDQPGLLYAAAPIHGSTPLGQQGTIGVVEAAQEGADIERTLERLRQGFLLAAGLVGLIAVGAGLLLARIVTRPIRRLEAVATAIAGGDLRRRATRLPHNEIGALGESFNRMATRLAGLLAEAQGEQARLTALLASLTDGVLACDAEGALTLENPAARTLLGVAHDAPAARGGVQASAAGLGVDALWRRAMGGPPPGGAPGGPIEAEIAAPGRTLLALAAPIQGGGAVCVLRDITRLRELEQSRTAILRRLGHELRTPLTALRAVLANLSDAAGPAQAAPLATAEAEAARLGRLVEEILAWSQGRTVAALDLRATDLAALAQTTCTLFAGRAARLGVALRGPEGADPPVVVRGDPDRLRQVLVNLLDNALRHTPPGGHVTVGVHRAGAEAVLQVADDGEGMDSQTSRWAFEPYYQGSSAAPAAVGAGGKAADADQPGHSGLGLAIVREIVGAHGGQIALESRPGAGTTVTIRVPLAPSPPTPPAAP